MLILKGKITVGGQELSLGDPNLVDGFSYISEFKTTDYSTSPLAIPSDHIYTFPSGSIRASIGYKFIDNGAEIIMDMGGFTKEESIFRFSWSPNLSEDGGGFSSINLTPLGNIQYLNDSSSAWVDSGIDATTGLTGWAKTSSGMELVFYPYSTKVRQVVVLFSGISDPYARFHNMKGGTLKYLQQKSCTPY